VLDPDDPVTLSRLSDLRQSQPADATLRNLLQTLSTKLELCARLPVLAYEADREGHTKTAAAFRRLAAVERRSLDELLESLKRHLEPTEAHVHTEDAS
jgi:rubrerythrin